MKYIIAIISILVIIVWMKPWQELNSDTAEEYVMPEDSLSVAIHDLLTNRYSDLEETKRLDNMIERFLRQWEIKGASLAIMKDGQLIYSKGYGYANVEDSIPMDVFHIMRVASVSKLITAAGVVADVNFMNPERQLFDVGFQGNPRRLRFPDEYVRVPDVEKHHPYFILHSLSISGESSRH